MARHLTVETIIDTHKIHSKVAYIQMLEIDVIDDNENLLETVYIAKNTENIVFNENTYLAADFNLDISVKTNDEPEIKLTAMDPHGQVRPLMQQHGGGVGFGVRYIVVNSEKIADGEAELSEKFEVIKGSIKDNIRVNFTLGAENPLRMRYPLHSQWRDRCNHEYKGARCKYSGPKPKCDYTLAGPNGCRAHDNEQNFGGFSGMSDLAI